MRGTDVFPLQLKRAPFGPFRRFGQRNGPVSFSSCAADASCFSRCRSSRSRSRAVYLPSEPFRRTRTGERSCEAKRTWHVKVALERRGTRVGQDTRVTRTP